MTGGFVGGLSGEMAALLREAGRPRRYERGETVLREGERGDRVIVVLDGWLKATASGPDGHEVILNLLGPGDLVGELAAITGADTGRSASVSALETVQCRVLTGDEFASFVRQHGEAGLALSRVVVAKLQATDRRLVERSSTDATQRLAAALAKLVTDHGLATDAGIELSLPLSQGDLAGLIGSSREALTRALATLRSRGLVTTARRRLVVHDVEGLRTFGR